LSYGMRRSIILQAFYTLKREAACSSETLIIAVLYGVSVTVAALCKSRNFSTAPTLVSCVRITLEAWMFSTFFCVFMMSCTASGLAMG
jgi:hypothetical protein